MSSCFRWTTVGLDFALFPLLFFLKLIGSVDSLVNEFAIVHILVPYVLIVFDMQCQAVVHVLTIRLVEGWDGGKFVYFFQ